jgi:glycosyltransferase involved in cell wall biosynthesis
MKLLYLSADPGVPVLGHKGASVHVRQLVEALAATGIEVAIASPRVLFEGERLDADVEFVEIDPVLPDHQTVAALRAAVRAQAVHVTKLAARLGVDAVYERFSLFSDAGKRAAAALEIPFVLEVNAPLRYEARLFRTLPHADEAAAIESAVFAATDPIFAVSVELRDALIESGVEAAKVEVLPNAIDPLKFAPRQEGGGTQLTIGFCGSLKPWHGIDVLLEAFRNALAEAGERTLRLEVVGSGPCERLLDGVDLPDGAFVRHGQLTHSGALRAMARWDVGVAPYLPVPRFYFSPLKVFEYMATGLCVIGSDLGQIRALLGNGDRGVLVPADDVGALADAFVALARDPARTRAMGKRSQSYVLSSHTWAGNAERVLRALRQGKPAELVA